MSEQKVEQAMYPVALSVAHPEKLSRLTTFFRAIMVIPHTICVAGIGIAAGVVDFIAWWAILFTGKFPKGLFDFVLGYFRWTTRVCGYSLLLTDKYPPFDLK
ncbi:MAG: DUF4389 domain-containing protein [Chloroflexota bacterium]